MSDDWESSADITNDIREWWAHELRKDGYTVQSQSDWRTEPPDKPGTDKYWVLCKGWTKPELAEVRCRWTPDDLVVCLTKGSHLEVEDVLMYCPATFPTPPTHAPRTPEGE